MKTTSNKIKRVNEESKIAKPVRWKPGSRLGKPVKPNGYRLRWCEDKPTNIAKKLEEGWEILDKTKFPEINNNEFDDRTTDSSGLTKSILKRNELVAMVIPEELAQERDEYFRQETIGRTKRASSHEEVRNALSRLNPRNKNNVVSFSPDNLSNSEQNF